MSSAVIAEEPSVPFILKFLSAVLTVNSTSVELFAISNIDVPPSLNVTLAPSASKTISPLESNVIVVPSASKVPSAVIVMLAAAAESSVVTILNVPLVPAVKTAVSLEEPVPG